MNEPLLPEPFAELTAFVDWALQPERARTEKKVASSMKEIRAFYDAMMERFSEVLNYLEGFSGDDMSPEAHRLFLMSLSLVEVATLVENYKRREAVDGYDPLRFVPVRR